MDQGAATYSWLDVVLGNAPPRPRCGRPLRTRPSESCTRWPLDGSPACRIHMTREEKAAHAARDAEQQAQQDAREPACWSWPLPAEVPNFGISWREVAKATRFIAEWQDHRCAICGCGSYVSTVVDHDHYTGLLRGILCAGCNTAEGTSGALIYQKYRERHPANMLGIFAPCDRPDPWRAPDDCLVKEIRVGIQEAVDRMHIAIPAPPAEETA